MTVYLWVKVQRGIVLLRYGVQDVAMKAGKRCNRNMI
jgi:hypothetical protein